MATELWVDPIHRGFNESHDEIRPRLAKISFSSKLKLSSTLPVSGARPIGEHGYFDSSRNGGLRKAEMFFARIGGFPEEGVKWVTENFNNIKLNLKRHEDLGTGALLGGFPEEGVKWVTENFKNIKLNAKRHEDLGTGALHGRPLRVSVPRGRRGGRPVVFASVSENIDPATKEQLEDTKEDVIDAAQKARVPVPSARLPFIGFINSLTIKNLICGILAGAAGATVIVPFDVLRTRVIAGQGGRTAGEVFSTIIHKEGLQALDKASLSFNIGKYAIEKGVQFTTYEFVKRYQERNRDSGRQKKVLPLPRQIPIATAGGAAGGLVATLLTYPLQPVFDRVLMQPDKYKTLVDATKQLLRNEGGFWELYRGITPALIAIVPTAAVSFYTYDTLKSRYLSKKNKLNPQMEAVRSLIIGGIAGAVSTTVTYPLELAREQIVLSSLSKKAVQFAEGNVRYNNTWQAVNGIAKAGGWQGLFRGLNAQVLQIAPMTAITFMVYELAKAAFVATDEESRDEIKDADDLKK